MEGLEGARLKGNTHLDLVKGGVTVPFGEQTAGEKARLKIATTLALIKIAEQRGIGRHPGLLLIDSPGARGRSNAYGNQPSISGKQWRAWRIRPVRGLRQSHPARAR